MFVRLGVLGVVASLMWTPMAYAADGALSEGHAAGVQKAVSFHGGSIGLWAAGGLVIGGLAVLVSDSGGTVGQSCTLSGCTSTTTTTGTTSTTKTTTTTTKPTTTTTTTKATTTTATTKTH